MLIGEGGISCICCVFFFFFKTKTAYEMLRSLVGSEMCIRDRLIIDDCIETGAAAEALFALIGEFGAEVCGFGTIVEISEPKVKAVKDYMHLITLNRSEAGIKLLPAAWLLDNLSQEGYA